MDTAQWPQEIGVVKPMEASPKAMVEIRRCRPEKDEALNCPRCNSTNTKFCYYNNYSLSQPRYLCKTCRRYWTNGGSLRNVPVGGCSRKNKRSLSNSSKLTTPPAGFPINSASHQNPKIHEGQDLNLAYPPPPEDWHFSNIGNNSNPHQNSSSSSTSAHHLSAMELLKTGINISRGLSSFMSMPMPVSDHSNAVFSRGFPMHHDFKPSTLNFSLDEFETDYGNLHQESGARLLFPMEELKQQVPSTTTTNELEQNRGQLQEESPAGYWSTGIMLGAGQHW